MAFSPFDWLKQITVTKKPWDSFTDEDRAGFNAFIINKALSYNQQYIPIVEIAMAYPMPNDKLYDFYKDIIPKKPMWNKWVKSNVKWDEDEIQILFNCCYGGWNISKEAIDQANSLNCIQ